MNKYLKTLLLASVTVGFLLVGDVQAQTVPSTADPGVITRDLGEERRAPSRLEDTVTLGDEQAGTGLSTEELFTLQAVKG